MRRRKYYRRPEPVIKLNIRANDDIRAKTVRLLNDDGTQNGLFSLEEALEMAYTQDSDLVEISSKGDYPVCRITDYSKFLFDAKKKQIQTRKSQKQIEQKTIKFRPNTNDGDYEIKMRKIHEFLEKGHRVKIVIWFRGREITHQELGVKMLEKIKESLGEKVRIDDEPKLEGKQMLMAVSPVNSK